MRWMMLPLALFVGCSKPQPPQDTATPDWADADGDGYDERIDCDDSDPAVHPGAAEVCGGIDEDCDGFVDDEDLDLADGQEWYADADGDGFGDPGILLSACVQPTGAVADGTDCDDAAADVHPGADEVCDGLDQDCDGAVDEDAVDAGTWYSDADGDGYGDETAAVTACTQPTGTVSDDTDCDDGEAAVNPDALEVCDGVDQDCDGAVDEDATDATTWYADADGDGYGDAATAESACTQPTGAVADDTDCDDGDSSVNPGAVEVCDGVDQDCDGTVDDEAVDVSAWYADADSDGYGDLAVAVTACTQPTGTVADATDCDDWDAGVNPGAVEVCDGVDQDCDGDVDEGAIDMSTWYTDADGDGYGDPGATVAACTQPTDAVADDTDCDDADAAVNPGAAEVCDSVDQDCDGDVDEDATDAGAWYVDVDGDGYGDTGTATVDCTQPSGTVAEGGDCDDVDAGVNPGETETCDGRDQDCDGDVDEEATDAGTWYPDLDGDGYGDPGGAVTACTQPSGTVAGDTDCDDGDASIFPGAAEYCDGVDTDCDGTLDPAATVTFVDAAGAPRDVTSDFPTSSSGTAAPWSFSSDGTLGFCTGDYLGTITVSAASAAIVGYDGSGAVTLSAAGTGPVILVAAGAVDLEVRGLTLTQGVGSNGGGVSSAVSGLDFVAEDLVVISCTATNGGGFYFNNATLVTLDQVEIEYGAANKGAGFYMDHGELDFDDLRVEYSTAASQGGGLYLKRLDASGSALLASNNAASDKGAGLYVDDATLELSDSEVSNNRCSDKGGGINAKGNASLDLIRTLVADNQAVSGGGLYLESSAGTCTGTATAATYEGFVRNQATSLGGALYVKGGSATWNATTCDFGSGSDDNSLYDVYVETGAAGYPWGDDAIFSCTASSCL